MNGDLMERTLQALDRLNKTYRIDRYLAMAAAVLSFALLFYIALMTFTSSGANWGLLAGFFAASGLLTAAMIRIAYFFNEGYKLVAQVVKAEIDRSAGE
jgi:hypothetical protein